MRKRYVFLILIYLYKRTIKYGKYDWRFRIIKEWKARVFNN